LRTALEPWRDKGLRIALVPTMGALHEGHLALVRAARRRADRVVVSIFVNPAQFGPKEDFARYPRTWKADIAKLMAEKADLVFAPAVKDMYPEGFATRIMLDGPARGLESDFRPHFFGGVATVVAKLLVATLPDFATFGEKDFQQLLVVRRMSADLGLPVEILGVPTVREKDGLALSSRNAYLSAEERARAPKLHAMLRALAGKLKRNRMEIDLSEGRRALTAVGFGVDYLEVRNAETLAPVGDWKSEPLRVLVAARLGKTRLIDNIAA
jgi:pantoate--beta-alanine ligase